MCVLPVLSVPPQPREGSGSSPTIRQMFQGWTFYILVALLNCRCSSVTQCVQSWIGLGAWGLQKQRAGDTTQTLPSLLSMGRERKPWSSPASWPGESSSRCPTGWQDSRAAFFLF